MNTRTITLPEDLSFQSVMAQDLVIPTEEGGSWLDIVRTSDQAAAVELLFDLCGKAPADVTDAEAALLASVLPNPKTMHVDRPSEYVRKRQAWVLEHMARLRRDGVMQFLD